MRWRIYIYWIVPIVGIALVIIGLMFVTSWRVWATPLAGFIGFLASYGVSEIYHWYSRKVDIGRLREMHSRTR